MDNTKYVSVPVEPTKEMLDAAERLDWANEDVRGNCINQWQAMIAAAPTAGHIRANSAEEAAAKLLAGQPQEFYSVRTWIEAAWCAGYYHAGYTHDSAYAEHHAGEFADHALSGLRGAERQAQDGPEFEDGPDEEGFKGPRPWNGFAQQPEDKAEQQAEPIGEIREIDHQHVPVWSNGTPEPGTKLYTAPPQQQMSDAEIWQMAVDAGMVFATGQPVLRFARALLAKGT